MGLRLVAVALGAVQAWAAAISQSMNADGISYLDIGDAYIRGDWETAISSVWSPMYSWILGIVMHLLRPPMHLEFPVVHLANFAIYVGALLCFEFFWRQLMTYRRARTSKAQGEGWATLPEWSWLPLGYLLFLWSSLTLINIWSVTPDMLMSGFVYLAAGLVVRIRMGITSWGTFPLLGVVLGLGYLAKSIMFPVSLIFLAVAVLSAGGLRHAAPRSLAALFAFLLLSMPFVGVISAAEGEFTIGTAGTLTYARYVNRMPYPHWQGETSTHGTLAHPTRQILDSPPIYEFGMPIGGTYPVSLNPSYWYEGLAVRFDMGQQVDYLLYSALFYFDLFFRQQAGLVAGVALLYLMGGWRPQWRRSALAQWGLVIPALVTAGFYALVCVAGRYVGVFVVLLWADLLANIRLNASQPFRRMASVAGAVMILFMLFNLAAFNLEGYRALTGKGDLNRGEPLGSQAQRPGRPIEVAQALQQLGVAPGQKVAVIGYGFDSFWARLARVQIVAEMLGEQADPFWLGSPSEQGRVVDAFASTGAEAIIAEHVPDYAQMAGWQQVIDTNFYVLSLRSE